MLKSHRWIEFPLPSGRPGWTQSSVAYEPYFPSGRAVALWGFSLLLAKCKIQFQMITDETFINICQLRFSAPGFYAAILLIRPLN